MRNLVRIISMFTMTSNPFAIFPAFPNLAESMWSTMIEKGRGEKMGAFFFFDEKTTSNDNSGNKSMCQVEVLDCSGRPEIRVGPVEEAFRGYNVEFNDWAQFERFVDAVNGVQQRLKGIH